MNNRNLTVTYCWSGFIFLVAIFFLNSCGETSRKQPGNTSSNDSLFISELTEQQLGKSRYWISIPPDYFIDVLEGPDFEVYYFLPTDTTIQSLFMAGVYFGNHPNKYNADNDSCNTEKNNSEILGKNAQWTLYNCNGEYSIQTIIDSKSGKYWNEYIHAFGRANSIAELPKLFDIFRTMRMRKEKE